MPDKSRTPPAGARVRKPERRGVEWVTLPRTVLGVTRKFGVWRPPGYDTSEESYPTLYLFRGQENEWAGRQDGREGMAAVLERMIGSGEIEPMLVVLPGFMEPSQKSQGLPVDWSARGEPRGVGNGRFGQHFFELKAIVEERYRVKRGARYTAVDGFSMGGYSALLLGTRHPWLFGSVGSYDGSYMWPGQLDPRRPPHGRADRLWFSETCAPFFRRDGVWDVSKMERHNPLTWIQLAQGRRLKALRQVRFHVRTAGSESDGNVDRGFVVVAALRRHGIFNTWESAALRLHPDAMHDWSWADIHLEANLVHHDAVFRGAPRVTPAPKAQPRP